MNCAFLKKHLDPFIDGELDAATQVDFEVHLAQCGSCHEETELERSFRRQLKESLREVQTPAALRERVLESLARSAPSPRRVPTPKALRFSPLPRFGRSRASATRFSPAPAWSVALASVFLVSGSWTWWENEGRVQSALARPWLDDVARIHSRASSPALGKQAMAQGGTTLATSSLPVQPLRFQDGNVRLVGAQMENLQQGKAATFYYDVGGRRLTMVVFRQPPSSTMQQEKKAKSSQEDVAESSPPAYREGDYTYAFTSDMDREALLRLAGSARVEAAVDAGKSAGFKQVSLSR